MESGQSASGVSFTRDSNNLEQKHVGIHTIRYLYRGPLGMASLRVALTKPRSNRCCSVAFILELKGINEPVRAYSPVRPASRAVHSS